MRASWQTFWISLLGVSPHRQDIRDRLAALPALPEADRMRTRPKTWPKPKTVAQWKQRYAS